jgi:hypothetical protein
LFITVAYPLIATVVYVWDIKEMYGGVVCGGCPPVDNRLLSSWRTGSKTGLLRLAPPLDVCIIIDWLHTFFYCMGHSIPYIPIPSVSLSISVWGTVNLFVIIWVFFWDYFNYGSDMEYKLRKRTMSKGGGRRWIHTGMD